MTNLTRRPKKLGVFTVGMGAVASTLFAGVEIIRRGKRPAVGSFTQAGLITDAAGAAVPVREALDLAPLEALEFGGVDLIEEDACAAARNAGVLNAADLESVGTFLSSIKAGPGVHDAGYVRTLQARRVRPERMKIEQAASMKRVYREFLEGCGADCGVVLLTLSTEAWRPAGAVHASPDAFRAGLERNDPEISPSQIYAWAAIDAGLPVVNCTPNLVLDAPAILALAAERGVPVAGSDLKSGQTLIKTVVAAGIARRLLGVRGWFSTNILGNRDGLVLNQPENFRAKEISKGSVLTDILDAKTHPELYGGLEHQVHINYYPPKGDNKEAWDSIQIFGWLGYEMDLKINFECRDSILAAPLVLDLTLLIDLAARRGAKGVQSWLGGYFKSPATLRGERLSNDLHAQTEAIDRQLRAWI
jgi:myo-inositol-1-phosphate synthase